MRRLIAGAAAFLLVLSSVGAQNAPGPNEESEANKGASEDYEPYEKAEFPGWLLDLRRAEVIFIGSLPLTLLFSSLSYDGYRLLRAALQPDAIQTAGAEAGSYTPAESSGLLIAGLSVSALVAILDFILGRLEKPESG